MDLNPEVIGSVLTYTPKEAGRTLKTPFVLLPPAAPMVSFRDDVKSPPSNGNLSLAIPVVSDGCLYVECLVPGGGKLGKGTVKWRHGGSNPAPNFSANCLQVTVVDIGDELDFFDNDLAGVPIGETSAWPTGPQGKEFTMNVDGGGAVVGESFVLRIESKLKTPRGNGLDAWYAVLRNIEVVIEVTPDVEAVNETDVMIQNLANALGIDFVTLKMLLTQLAGGI